MGNRLAGEASPYLRQHAGNPVDWHPWGEEAFAKARTENKPIFLSVGYSTCHWCHVMERESFEDPGVASVLNAHFVSIKVDREERPDVDQLYMAFVQATTGQGGWPMSVWLTPELEPFAGGTYFPKEDRQGRRGLLGLLGMIARLWQESPDPLRAQGREFLRELQEAERAVGGGGAEVPEGVREKTREWFVRSFDAVEGGFGGAPKFPRPVVFTWLFREAERLGRDGGEGGRLAAMALFTLRKMAAGGIFDPLGGGFHRYAVDGRWHVPHFEKMLYDQAQMVAACLEAWQWTGEGVFAETAREVLGYVRRDLAHPGGGFYSAEDADSLPEAGADEKREGAYYVWTRGEIRKVLTEEEAEEFERVYDVHEGGNVEPESDPHGELSGVNVLIRRGEVRGEDTLRRAREKLLERRGRRPRPHLDDKVLASWNGLMISAFARAGAVLGEAEYLRTAERGWEFLCGHLMEGEAGLFRTSREGPGKIRGFAIDYACVIQAALDLYEVTGGAEYLRRALVLQERMDRDFGDGEAGGYFGVAAEAGDIRVRMKEDYDGAEPAAGSVALGNLLRLAAILKREEFTEKAGRVLGAFRRTLERFGPALPLALAWSGWLERPPAQVVLAGYPGTEDFQRMRAAVWRKYHGRRVVLTADGGEGQAAAEKLGVPLRGFKPVGDKAAVYVCEDFACREPVTEAGEI